MLSEEDTVKFCTFYNNLCIQGSQTQF